MRARGRVDNNHSEVVKALRSAGINVQSLAQVGGGVPDLLCSYRNLNMLLEVKDGSKYPSERVLTKDEEDWHAAWSGQVAVVTTPDEAVLAVVNHAKACGKI